MIVLAIAASTFVTIYPTQVPKAVHLKDLLVYADCQILNEPLVDDGHADPKDVARALAQRCSEPYRKWLAVVTAGAKSMGVQSNYDMALVTVEMARRAPAPLTRNSN